MPIQLNATYIGGPTVLLEFGGFRILTDPTFDPPGLLYQTGPVTLHKLEPPALTPERLGPIDFVLLSHDHHFDNLDHSGREVLKTATQVFTTLEGAERLGGNAIGLGDWQETHVSAPSGRSLRIVATPARHGPEGPHRGEVQGFVFFFEDTPEDAVYISGDTVWYEGVEQVAKRFPVKVALLHLGAARVHAVGPFHLTMTSAEGATAARAFPQATIVPIHFEGWAHFVEGAGSIHDAFAAQALEHRLRWLDFGRPVTIDL